MPIKLSTPKPKEKRSRVGRRLKTCMMPYSTAKVLMEHELGTLEQLKKIFKIVLDRIYYK